MDVGILILLTGEIERLVALGATRVDWDAGLA
jgi:hypothetical protein